jgi:hydrogenase maturation protease
VTGRTVVAGVGNVFLGDDGFGVELAARLMTRPLPPGVEVVDVGIRGMHLAFDLLDGCELLVLLDASARGEPPGTLTVLQVDPGAEGHAGGPDPGVADGHGMTPAAVLGLVRSLGGRLDRVTVVACEPADLGEGIGLSEPVRAAVDAAVPLVERLIGEEEGAWSPQ